MFQGFLAKEFKWKLESRQEVEGVVRRSENEVGKKRKKKKEGFTFGIRSSFAVTLFVSAFTFGKNEERSWKKGIRDFNSSKRRRLWHKRKERKADGKG